MQVSFNVINFTPKHKKQNNTTSPIVARDTQLKEYSPAAYQDFNVSFGERLFRTPQNFYEQDFNEKNMPKTLHEYIYDGVDTDFKRTIPPAQAMKEAFGKINFAKDLDTVKLMFPNEPLFANLSSTPNKKSREGLLGMINLLKDDPEYKAQNRTLFKNGQDDLGMYILKKIYLEGKTLKEINKDFARDVSVHYKSYDIKPQDYAAFGIRFPEKPFWKSFVATREDFPYVYIPRTTAERVQTGDRTHSSSAVEPTLPKKKRQPLSFVERKRLSEAMVNWHASMTDADRQAWLEKMKVGREASVFHNYFGEIVTIAQDKVDHAGKMAAFFEKVYGDPEYMQSAAPKKDKDLALSRFWKAHPQHRLNYSKAMNEVIADFDKAYGQDGDSPEFRDLLTLAESIAAKNEENRQLRAEARAEAARQAEEAKKMEELSRQAEAILQAEEKAKAEAEKAKPMTYDEMLESESAKNGAKIYKFELSDGTPISIVANFPEMINNKLDQELMYMPSSFRSKYKKFFVEHPSITDKYLLSLFYADKMGNFTVNEFKGDTLQDVSQDIKSRMNDELKDQFMTHEEVEEIGKIVHRDFDMKNTALVRSTDQALMELIYATPLPDHESFRELAAIRFADLKADGLIPETFEADDNEEIMTMLEKRISDDMDGYHGINLACMDTSSMGAALGLLLGGEPLTKEQQRFLDTRTSYYRTPLTTSESRKVTLTVVNELLKFDLGSIIGRNEDSVGHIYDAAMATVKKYPEVRGILTSLLQKRYITSEDSDMRCFLDKNVDKKVKEARLYKLVIDIIHNDPDFFKFVVCMDSDILNKYIKPYDPTLYETMIQFRVFGANALKDVYKK